MSKDTGGPAFPVYMRECDKWVGEGTPDGMTLRDYFAAKAMSSLLHAMMLHDDQVPFERIAFHAYMAADTMIEKRNK